jgi:hypothetical protein
LLLLAGILAFLVGPVLLGVLGSAGRLVAFVDGLGFILIAGLICFGILPEAIEEGGRLAWAFAAAGLAFPILLEKSLERAGRGAHIAIVVISVVGLLVHATIDGMALASSDPDEVAAALRLGASGSGADLALAVILHRFAEGMAVWCFVAPTLGPGAALGLLALLISGNAAGYFGGEALLGFMRAPQVAWFQSFVAGLLLHVLMHGVRPHGHGGGLVKWPERTGVLVGLILLFLYL